MTTVSTKYVGPFRLTRFPSLNQMYIIVTAVLEGGRFDLAQFETEVCPWDDLGEGMEERVRDFYAANIDLGG